MIKKTADEKDAILADYNRRFKNLDQLINPAILRDPRFIELLEAAIKSGKKLTRKKMEGVFGPLSWEW